MIRHLIISLCIPAALLAQSTNDIVLTKKTAGGYGKENLTPANSSVWTFDGSGHADTAPVSELGFDLLNAANSAAIRSAAALGTMATQSASAVAITGGTMTGVSITTMGAYKISDSFSADTIAVGEAGLGWADGKVTIQTPVGAMQFYEAGEPLEPVIYWPGRIVAATLETALLTTTVEGSQITSGTIPSPVMVASIPHPLNAFQDDAAHAGSLGGLTYSNTGPLSANEAATPGKYFAMIEVVDGGSGTVNHLEGRIMTPAQAGVPALVSAPATASSTGSAGQMAYDSSYLYICTATNTWKRVAISSW